MRVPVWIAFGLAAAACSRQEARGYVKAADPGCTTVEACTKRCEQSGWAACRQLGRWYEDGDGVAADPPRALGLYDRACTANDSEACTLQGVLLALGAAGVPHDQKRAVQLFRKACDAREVFGCAQLGNALLTADGVDRDVATASRLLDEACAADVPTACDAAGHAAEFRGDLEAARRHYQRSCDGGYAPGCTDLAGTSKKPSPAAKP